MDHYVYLSLENIERIARHCPRALSTYIICTTRANEGKVEFSKEEIINDLSETWCRFRNNLKSLALENILSWKIKGEDVYVTLHQDSNYSE